MQWPPVRPIPCRCVCWHRIRVSVFRLFAIGQQYLVPTADPIVPCQLSALRSATRQSSQLVVRSVALDGRLIGLWRSVSPQIPVQWGLIQLTAKTKEPQVKVEAFYRTAGYPGAETS